MAVSRSIVEAHGGRLWAENDADGGARFSVALPLCPAERDLLKSAINSNSFPSDRNDSAMVTFYGPLRTGRIYARNLVSDDSVRRNGAGAWLCRRPGVGTSQHGTGSRPSRRTTLMSLLKLQMRRSPLRSDNKSSTTCRHCAESRTSLLARFPFADCGGPDNAKGLLGQWRDRRADLSRQEIRTTFIGHMFPVRHHPALRSRP